MKKIRLAFLGILIISLLMNLPAIERVPGWENLGGATASARPLFVPSDADAFGSIFSDGFESGDISSWSTSDPGNLVDRKSPSGLGKGEKFTGIDSIPPSGGLNVITDEGDNGVIGISNLGGVYKIDCENGSASIIGSTFSDVANPLDPLDPNNSIGTDIHPSTRFWAFSNTEVGNRIVAINVFNTQLFEVGNTLFFPQNDPNADKTPKVTGLAFADAFEDSNVLGIDSANDFLVQINRHTGETKTVGSLGVNVSCRTEMDIAPKNNSSDPDQAFMSAMLEGENFSRFYTIDLQTGQATDLGTIGDGTEQIESFTFVRPLQAAATCQIEQTSDKNSIGSRHDLTVTVFLDGQPVSGANVSIEVISGPNDNLAGTSNTDSDGEAAFNYTGSNTAGTDTIRASGTVNGNPFSCTATVEWKEFLITNVKDNKGKQGQNIVVIGLNFQDGDQVLINGQAPNKTKFKQGSRKLVAKNGEALLNQCTGGTPVTNTITVRRNPPGPMSQPIIDTTAFATCP